MKKVFILFALLLGLKTAGAEKNQTPVVRIKDLVEVRGVRNNSLSGFGLVVGLQGTGDSKASVATNKATSNILSRLGIPVSPQEVTTKNIAAVVVTAELPPFARVGDKLDLRISSIGDASSLEGGTLLLTTLSGADDLVYATAQGSISQGTAMAGGGGSNSTAPKTISIAKAGIVEKEFDSAFVNNNAIELSLKSPDFTTATRISTALNEKFGEFIANPVNGGLVQVQLPTTVSQDNPSFNPVAFMAALEQTKVVPDTYANIVINERTGTIVAGQGVVLFPVAISHGDLEIQIGEKTQKTNALPSTATVEELVKALNQLGAGPKDIVSILQSLEAAQALKAQIKLM